MARTHGPLPQNASLFMGFAFMMTASSESDRLSNKLSSDEEEGGDLLLAAPLPSIIIITIIIMMICFILFSRVCADGAI